MALIEQIKQFQTGSISITSVTKNTLPGTLSVPNVTGSMSKTLESLNKLSSKQNEISSFLNDSGINGGDQPFSIAKFAREFITKQQTTNEGETSKVTDSRPITRKVNQITKKVVDGIVQNYLQSGKLLSLLETQVNKILKQASVQYVSVENGQIQAQPIQNKEVDQAITNIQKILDGYTKSIDKAARRIYNTDPIKSTKDLQQNLSLNHTIDFIKTIISIALLILQIKIKIRKAQDIAAAANAAAQVPVPNIALAAKLTQQATENTAGEQKQLDDLASTQERILAIKGKIDFYGKKYEMSKSKILDLQSQINSYQTGLFNKALQGVNNQLTGSYNQVTGSVTTKLTK
jgi:hypothetical protein